MTVRMKDIARDLGVSVITVSKALRNHSDISAETRARVLKRVKELDYRPNLAARALVTGRTHMMGLVVPELVHTFFSEIARGLAGALRNSGYTLVISSSEQDPELERQAVEQLVARRVDALLVASAQWTVESFRRVEEAGIPYVLVDRSFSGLAANFVGVNDEQVGRIATEHLIEVGCRRIAHISAPWLSPVLGRLEGYKKALAHHGLPIRPDYVLNTKKVSELGDAAGYDAVKKLLQLNPRPDGIFCYNDTVAMGAMNAVLDAGLHIPDQIAVVGCGNLHFSSFLRVPLTSVDQQSTNIGQRAAKLALSLVGAKAPGTPKTILLEPKLVVRDSTKRSAHSLARSSSES